MLGQDVTPRGPRNRRRRWSKRGNRWRWWSRWPHPDTGGWRDRHVSRSQSIQGSRAKASRSLPPAWTTWTQAPRRRPCRLGTEAAAAARWTIPRHSRPGEDGAGSRILSRTGPRLLESGAERARQQPLLRPPISPTNTIPARPRRPCPPATGATSRRRRSCTRWCGSTSRPCWRKAALATGKATLAGSSGSSGTTSIAHCSARGSPDCAAPVVASSGCGPFPARRGSVLRAALGERRRPRRLWWMSCCRRRSTGNGC